MSSERKYALLKEREARFSESEGKFSVLVENVATGILLREKDGTIEYANPAFVNLVEKAVEIIASESGRHFDPEFVKVFLEFAEEFRAISER
jgi:PAS domain-containing protein